MFLDQINRKSPPSQVSIASYWLLCVYSTAVIQSTINHSNPVNRKNKQNCCKKHNQPDSCLNYVSEMKEPKLLHSEVIKAPWNKKLIEVYTMIHSNYRDKNAVKNYIEIKEFRKKTYRIPCILFVSVNTGARTDNTWFILYVFNNNYWDISN